MPLTDSPFTLPPLIAIVKPASTMALINLSRLSFQYLTEDIMEHRLISLSPRPEKRCTRAQQREKQSALRDGPFAESKEMIGGVSVCLPRQGKQSDWVV